MSDVNKQLLFVAVQLVKFQGIYEKNTGEQGCMPGNEMYGEMLMRIVDCAKEAIAAAEQAQPEQRCACGDSFTSDAVCANCLAAPQQAELVTKTDTSLITAADAALRYIAAMHSAEVPLEPFSAAVTAQALASALHPHKTPVGREADSKMVMAISTTQQQAEPVAWQFYENGRWWSGDDRIKDHRKHTEDAGIPTRDLYAQPPAQPVARDVLMAAMREAVAECAEICDVYSAYSGARCASEIRHPVMEGKLADIADRYAAQPPAVAVAVPDGYALVPIEPTSAMLCAGQKEWIESAGADPSFDIYRAMLAAQKATL